LNITQLETLRGDERCYLLWWEWLLIAVFAIYVPLAGSVCILICVYRKRLPLYREYHKIYVRLILVALILPIIGFFILLVFTISKKSERKEKEVWAARSAVALKKKVSKKKVQAKSDDRDTYDDRRATLEAKRTKRRAAKASQERQAATPQVSSSDSESSSGSSDSVTDSGASSSLSRARSETESDSTASSSFSSSTDASPTTATETSMMGDDIVCKICGTAVVAVLLSCSHSGYCKKCERSLKNKPCPECGKIVVGTIDPF
jgi:hypothetical protein